jgi:TPR repeat protein
LILYYAGIGFSEVEAEFLITVSNQKKVDTAEAMMLIACLHETANIDLNKCMHWNHKAAEAGSEEAMYRLHQILHPDFALAFRGYPKGDATKSLYWARKAAEHGNAKGMNAMGVYCWYGARNNDHSNFIMEPNRKEAVKWWTKAADAGSSDAQARLKEFQTENKQ